jgi:hypothetical protein
MAICGCKDLFVWNNSDTYNKGHCVFYDTGPTNPHMFRSKIDGNTNIIPGNDPAAWESSFTDTPSTSCTNTENLSLSQIWGGGQFMDHNGDWYVAGVGTRNGNAGVRVKLPPDADSTPTKCVVYWNVLTSNNGKNFDDTPIVENTLTVSGAVSKVLTGQCVGISGPTCNACWVPNRTPWVAKTDAEANVTNKVYGAVIDPGDFEEGIWDFSGLPITTFFDAATDGTVPPINPGGCPGDAKCPDGSKTNGYRWPFCKASQGVVVLVLFKWKDGEDKPKRDCYVLDGSVLCNGPLLPAYRRVPGGPPAIGRSSFSANINFSDKAGNMTLIAAAGDAKHYTDIFRVNGTPIDVKPGFFNASTGESCGPCLGLEWLTGLQYGLKNKQNTFQYVAGSACVDWFLLAVSVDGSENQTGKDFCIPCKCQKIACTSYEANKTDDSGFGVPWNRVLVVESNISCQDQKPFPPASFSIMFQGVPNDNNKNCTQAAPDVNLSDHPGDTGRIISKRTKPISFENGCQGLVWILESPLKHDQGVGDVFCMIPTNNTLRRANNPRSGPRGGRPQPGKGNNTAPGRGGGFAPGRGAGGGPMRPRMGAAPGGPGGAGGGAGGGLKGPGGGPGGRPAGGPAVPIFIFPKGRRGK